MTAVDRVPGTAVAAVVVLGVAGSPLAESAGRDSLSAHMIQHLVLVFGAAPLVALAWPGLRPPPGPWGRWAAGAIVVHATLLTGWHVPALFDAGQRAAVVHLAEHSAFVVAGVALWAVVLPRRGDVPPAGAVLAVFLAGLPGLALGVAMTTAPRPWYASYRGAGSLTGQQLAGGLMWGLGGLGYLGAGVALFAAWLAGRRRC